MNKVTFNTKLKIIGVKSSDKTKEYVENLRHSDNVDFEKISPETIECMANYGKKELEKGNIDMLKICMMYDMK